MILLWIYVKRNKHLDDEVDDDEQYLVDDLIILLVGLVVVLVVVIGMETVKTTEYKFDDFDNDDNK